MSSKLESDVFCLNSIVEQIAYTTDSYGYCGGPSYFLSFHSGRTAFSLKPKSGLKPGQTASPSIIFLEQHSYEEPSSLFIIFPSENGDAIIGKRHKIDRVVFWERQQLIFFHKGMAFFRALLTTVKIN